jgi:positive regulator of sigma E activity
MSQALGLSEAHGASFSDWNALSRASRARPLAASELITSEGATIASTVTYLLPVVAIVLGVLVLGENITAMILTGIAVVLAGVALTRHRSKAAAEP